MNGKELSTKDNVKFEVDQKNFTYSLVIPKVQPSHSGNLIIRAENSVGHVEHSINIDVLGKFKFYFFVFMVYFFFNFL